MKIGKWIRFIYRFLFAFASRHAWLILVSLIGGIFFFFISFHITPLLKQLLQPEVKKISIVGRYTPQTLPITIQRLIGRGLTEVAENGEPIPGIAQSWEVEDSGKTYIFHLQPDLFWHDGKKFTASDINYSIRDVTFIPKDDTTLVVKLEEPFAPLPVLLSRPLLRPGLVGMGPYKMTALKLKGEMVETIHLTPLVKGLSRLILRSYLNEEEAKIAFKIGEVDILEEVNNVAEFPQWSNVEITERIDYRRFVALFFNLEDPLLSDKAVRQALSFAVPNLEYERATGPISPLSWVYSNKVRQYRFDLDTAHRLLKKDKINLATQAAELTIVTFTSHLSLAKRIAESWQSLDFKINVKIADVVPDDFQVLLATQEIPPDPDQYPLWHSTQKETNITRIANPKIDKLLEDGRIKLDKEERLRIYTDFQRYLVDETPATFLYYPSVYTVSRK